MIVTATDHVIWTYEIDYEDWREDMESEYPEENEQWRIERANEINYNYLDDERCNLNIQLSRPIILIAEWKIQRLYGNQKRKYP